MLDQLLRLGLGKRMPVVDGRLEVDLFDAEVVIQRDDHGVPYIEAQTEADAYAAIGFCHGQDRATQLEITVRGVRGTLAELIGTDGVAIDRLSRRIGFKRAGERQLARAEVRVAAQLEAYARGVNAAFAKTPVPHELELLGRKAPTPWEASDVQGYSALLCFALASNWDVELMRLSVLVHDGPEALLALDLPYPEDLPLSQHPTVASGGRLVERLAKDLAAFHRVMGTGGGSNAWAVKAHKSSTGRPILACDPHLVAQLPALLYLLQVRAPGVEMAGASWVGVPACAPGHNGFAAWGVTAAHADNTDWFVEALDDAGRRVRDGDGWAPLEFHEERIVVKGGADVVERVRVGPRGPLVVEARDDVVGGDAVGQGYALALGATWLADRPYTGLYRAHEARSFAQMRDLFARGSTSTVSAVYADEEDAVGWFLAAEVPERRGHGLLPQAGWEGGFGDVIPFSQMPHTVEPPEGFVCTANNQPRREDDGPFLGADWLDGYRQRRIAACLHARDDWDVDGCFELQRDVMSQPWLEVRDVIMGLSSSDPDVLLGLRQLAGWTGSMASESVGASVFGLFCHRMVRRLVEAKAPRTAAWALGKPFTALLPTSTLGTRHMGKLVRLLGEQPAGWFAAGWGITMEGALGEAVAELRRRRGHDTRRWTWGEVRPLVLRHPFSQQPPLDRIFDLGPLPGEGDNTTVAQGGVDYARDLTHQEWLPMLRAVFDVGAWDNCRMAVSGGQSGNPLSPHYRDQLGPWRERGIPLVWSPEAIAQRVRHRLVLSPR